MATYTRRRRYTRRFRAGKRYRTRFARNKKSYKMRRTARKALRKAGNKGFQRLRSWDIQELTIDFDSTHSGHRDASKTIEILDAVSILRPAKYREREEAALKDTVCAITTAGMNAKTVWDGMNYQFKRLIGVKITYRLVAADIQRQGTNIDWVTNPNFFLWWDPDGYQQTSVGGNSPRYQYASMGKSGTLEQFKFGRTLSVFLTPKQSIQRRWVTLDTIEDGPNTFFNPVVTLGVRGGEAIKNIFKTIRLERQVECIFEGYQTETMKVV